MTATVKHKSVSIDIYEWQGKFRFIWHDSEGSRRYTTRNTLDKAKAEALTRAKAIHNQSHVLTSLTDHQRRALVRLLEVDPTLALIDEFIAYHGKKLPTTTVATAKTTFLATKEENRGASNQNVRTLTIHLAALDPLADRQLSSLTPADILPLITKESHAPRTRLNLHRSFSTFFRWALKVGHLPDKPTVMDQMERPILTASTPATYTPDQLDILLANVVKPYLPWIALAAWAGIRTDEMFPLYSGDKPALDWSDIDFARDIITVRPEVAKTKRRRVIPLLPCLKAVLQPLAQPKGRICPLAEPSKGKDRPTSILGPLIGGWQQNALRHSFISYRAAHVGISQTAMEAGNSETEARRSYNDSKSVADADRWFRVPKRGKKAAS